MREEDQAVARPPDPRRDQAVARPPDPRRVGAEAAAVAGATEAGAAAPGPDLGRVLLPLRLHGGGRLEAGEQQMRWRRHERSGGGRVELRRGAARVRGDGGGSGCSGPRSGEGTRQGGTPSSPFQTFSYMAERIVVTGLFGIVFQAKCLETGETMAIKKVLQDRRYKNWELQLMCTVNHSNVVSLKDCFFSTTSRDELFLNLVMEYIPKTFYRVLNNYSNAKQGMPLIYLKLYTYQGPCVHSYCSWSLS